MSTRISGRRYDWCKIFLVPFAAGLCSLSPGSQAQENKFPSRPITVVIGSSSGSSMELEVRILSDAVRETMGQPLLVELRPGANGAAGASVVMRAKPDGYTLFSSPASPMVFNPLTNKNLNYDPKRMTPIIEIGSQPLVLVARGDFPGNSLKDLADYSRTKQAGSYYGSTGIGGGNHMSVLLLERHVGAKFRHVPYPGAGPATQSLLKGETDFAILSIASLLPWYKDNKLKFFAMGSKERSPDAPDVPTFRELGYPDEFVLTAWRVLVGPPGMPPAIVQTINMAINKAYESPVVRDRFKALGLEATGGTPEEVAHMLAGEFAKWEHVAHESNIEKQ